MSDYYAVRVGGPAGFGIKSTGLAFSRVATRSGYQLYNYVEYPSIIRGGHNTMQTVISPEPVTAPVQNTDFLIALNQETIDLHAPMLNPGGFVLYDADKGFNTDAMPDHAHALAAPILQITKDAGGSEIMRNTCALAITLNILGGDIQILKDFLAQTFARKGEEVVATNQAVAQAGYDYGQTAFQEHNLTVLSPRSVDQPAMVIDANEAVALGSIAAGLQFAAIYPMTPTSAILEHLAPHQQTHGFIYKQPEDEISGINMALGAGFAGARSLVATSGGGFCLMTEGYGLGAFSEIPLVIVMGMRGAPATGLPTWTEQGDLQFVLHAHHGDFPRLVLAAGDAEEAFHLTMQAFNLAERYQTPVILLVDKMICESSQSYQPFAYDDYAIDRGKLTFDQVEEYQRFALSDDGISLRSIPGVGNHVVANSDEHEPAGYSSESAENRHQQMNKRMQKQRTCAANEHLDPLVYGPEHAPLTVVSWGSNKGAILQAQKELAGQGIHINFIHNIWMSPFPTQKMTELLEKADYLLNIECNYTHQHANLIREHTGIQIQDHLLKSDGRPIYPEEIISKVNSIISN